MSTASQQDTSGNAPQASAAHLFDNRVVQLRRGHTALSVPHADDVPYWNHINNPAVAATLAFRGKVHPLHATQAFFASTGADPHSLLWSIAALDDNGAVVAIIGSCSLSISPERQKGDLGITINFPEHHGKGHGTAAVAMMLQWAFEQLPLRKVSLDVFDGNAKALATYTTNGFKEVGRRRNEVWGDTPTGPGWADLILMEVFREEWAAMQTPPPLPAASA